MTKYYFAGASRIAVRKYVIPQSSTLTYLAGDHLGSTSLAVDASTGDVTETRYKPWGEVRWTSENKTLPTRYTFTGQYSYMNDEATDLGAAGFGLMFYNARWYDPALGRFAQADSIVPGGVQGYDRYAYVNNSPLRYTDPSGHRCENGDEDIWGYCNFAPPTLVFTGSQGQGDMNSPGPAPDVQAPAWVVDDNGNKIRESDLIPFPGNDAGGKPAQAESAQGKYPDAAVILICYSAGTEACLLYAQWRIENGQPVDAVILLGPTFVAPRNSEELQQKGYVGFGTADGKFDDWADYLDSLLIAGVDVLVVDDRGGGGDQANGFQSSDPTATGTFEYLYVNYEHICFADPTCVNINESLQDWVYSWIGQH